MAPVPAATIYHTATPGPESTTKQRKNPDNSNPNAQNGITYLTVSLALPILAPCRQRDGDNSQRQRQIRRRQRQQRSTPLETLFQIVLRTTGTQADEEGTQGTLSSVRLALAVYGTTRTESSRTYSPSSSSVQRASPRSKIKRLDLPTHIPFHTSAALWPLPCPPPPASAEQPGIARS